MGKLISTKEAAKILDVSTITMWRYVKTGKVKGQKIGHFWAADEDSVREFKKRLEGKSKNDPTRK